MPRNVPEYQKTICGFDFLFPPCVPWLKFLLMQENMKTQQLRKGLFQFTTVRIHSITAGRQGRNSNRAGN